MKLKELKLQNFRGYKTETIIKVDDLTSIIGKNDAGKSTILEALEIFFNNKLISCDRQDLNIEADSTNILITCVFTDFPDELILDAAINTSLANEYLLNEDSCLEICKSFKATVQKPKENIYIKCNHPSNDGCSDLLTLKRTELRTRAQDLGVPAENYNGSINSSIRSAIWNHQAEIEYSITNLHVDKEDTKKVYAAIEKYLPIYALFQSDRNSKDEDKEVVDPMKIAVQQALAELTDEIDAIKTKVRNKAIDTANRTLAKLNEMSPDLANELVPEFKSEPKFDSQFKLSINSEEGIPINKRGSGVRRLILLNFFRAEAERLRDKGNRSNVIYAFEEPETSQHPDHQELLVRSFLELSSVNGCQILITTHTPALPGLLPTESVRFIEKSGHDRNVTSGTKEVFENVVASLGILPSPIPKDASAILLLEGKGDIFFVNHMAKMLNEAGYISSTFIAKKIALVPIGGCGNLKHWSTLQLADQFGIPYCVLLDSDKGTAEAQGNSIKIQIEKDKGIKAYLTKKREPENYISVDRLELEEGHGVIITDECDAKIAIHNATGKRKSMTLENFWKNMNAEDIRNVEKYHDGTQDRYEFTEMFEDFLSVI